MAKETFGLTGFDELERAFKRLPKKLGERAVLNATRAGARVVAKEAKRLAPTGKTGDLKRGIAARTIPKSKRTKDALVDVTVKGPAAFRAHFIEFGRGPFTIQEGRFKGTAVGPAPAQPFLRPAAANTKRDAIRKMGEIMGAQVEKQAAALIKQNGLDRKKR